MSYTRLTVKGANLDKKDFSGVNYSGYVSYELDEEALDLVIKAVNHLAELEDKIEQGTLIYPKYPLYSTVFIIDYVDEKGYSVGFGEGKPKIRECFITTVSQVMKKQILYRVQPRDLAQEVLDGEIEHIEHWELFCYQDKDLFPNKPEAEKRLKELQE